MYKIAILGCENSHANNFLRVIYKEKLVSDVEVVGVYSYDMEAAQKLHEEYGVAVAESYDAFVGKVDGIMITARHGDNHYKYAKPYLDSGIPMYIDKPITCTEADAKAFMQELKDRNVRVSGGSLCVLNRYIQELKQTVLEEKCGKVIGGYLRAPIIMDSPHGGFFFYAQHLAQSMMEIFGYYPESVLTWQKGENVYCDVHYADYDVDLTYTGGCWKYYGSVSGNDDLVCKQFTNDDIFEKGFVEFHNLLEGKPQKQTYEDFFAPVFVLNAMYRSLQSGQVERVKRIEEI
ncbi:MAG: Gfo/Idh/MocA family oxidoreductase [Ruminococcaceae bacterium]|nr:Gfo/Idh/MocA family oxidoreductase [Oscillospiraceae bacterium]